MMRNTKENDDDDDDDALNVAKLDVLPTFCWVHVGDQVHCYKFMVVVNLASQNWYNIGTGDMSWIHQIKKYTLSSGMPKSDQAETIILGT
jgi:hypothetical protein